MFSWKSGVLLTAALILAGCSNRTPIDTSFLEQPKQVHPDWPRSPARCAVPDYKVGTDSQMGSVVMIPYKQYLNQRGCERDRLRYTSSLTGLACFYRQDIKEPICQYYYPQKEEK